MPIVMENNTDKVWRTKENKGYTGRAFPPDTKDETFLTYYAEEQVLSALFMHRFAEELGHDVITPVLEILRPEHFSDAPFKGWRYLIYRAVYESKKHVDILNVCKWLVDNNLYQKGIDDYINLICDYNLTSLDAEHYASVVIEYHNKRNNIKDDAVKGIVEL